MQKVGHFSFSVALTKVKSAIIELYLVLSRLQGTSMEQWKGTDFGDQVSLDMNSGFDHCELFDLDQVT